MSDAPVTEVAANPEELGEGTVIIPLDRIWAYRMPGTQNVEELSLNSESLPQHFGTLTTRAGNFHCDGDDNHKAGPGFAVVGVGQDALIAAHRKLPAGSSTPKNAFPKGSAVSVVFFAGGFNSFVHIHQVEQTGSTIKIYYKFSRNPNAGCTWHFALIPAGGLPTGKYHVEVVEHRDTEFKNKWGVEIEETWAVDPVRVRQAVCDSFSFSIAK